MLEAQKSEKNKIKHLDVQLNNTMLYLKKLLNIHIEWIRLENILTAEQKWLDEIDVSILDLSTMTSNNYSQMLYDTQVLTICNIYFLYNYLIIIYE